MTTFTYSREYDNFILEDHNGIKVFEFENSHHPCCGVFSTSDYCGEGFSDETTEGEKAEAIKDFLNYIEEETLFGEYDGERLVTFEFIKRSTYLDDDGELNYEETYEHEGVMKALLTHGGFKETFTWTNTNTGNIITQIARVHTCES